MFRRIFVGLLLRLFMKRLWARGIHIDALRRKAAWIDRWYAGVGSGAVARSVNVQGVPAIWIDPRTDPQAASALGVPGTRGVLLYLHGGAFSVHLPAVYQRLAANLVRRTGMSVLLPDYRLAPEHPYPAGLDDCCKAYRWLLAQGHAPQRIAIAGDSAGGNLTLATLMRLQSEGVPLPSCAAALSPLTDFAGLSPSWDYNERSDVMFDRRVSSLVRQAYVGTTALDDAGISPLYGDWRGLPPLLLHASSSEMLLGDTLRAAERARAAGVQVTEHIWRGLPHVFQLFRLFPEAGQALNEIALHIRTHLVQSAPSAAPSPIHQL